MVSIRIDFSKSKQGHLTYAVKTFSVQRSKTMLYDCCTMFCGRVAHIFVPIIQRVRLVSFNHEIITISLGKNWSSGYALKFSVSFDNGSEDLLRLESFLKWTVIVLFAGGFVVEESILKPTLLELPLLLLPAIELLRFSKNRLSRRLLLGLSSKKASMFISLMEFVNCREG